MSFSDELSGTIARIYDTAAAGEGWDELGAEMLRLVGGQWLLACIVDHERGELPETRFVGIDPARAARGFQEHRAEMKAHDATLSLVRREPHRRWIDSEAAFGRQDYADHHYVKWHRSRFGTTHWRIGTTPVEDGISLALSVHAKPDQGPIDAAGDKVFRTLFDHYERALRFMARRPRLDGDDDGLILLDHEGRVREMNDAARSIVAARDGLAIADGRLHATAPTTAEQLRGLLNAALGDFATAAAGTLSVLREAGRRWIVRVTPCPSGPFPFDMRLPGALVSVRDPNAVVITSAQRAAFLLTRREAELAERLLNGLTLEDAAQQLGISPNTARVHLRSVFAKTGTNRQVDLVRVLLVTV